ncbi:DegT/DnrJ/EryC1/StrS family aminotransferase [bacterium]|nr:DegT/DnrJ/EryC1/StrS family aminotransferase [bacterium]
MIKMYDFKKQYESIKKEINFSIQSVLDDSAFSSGKYVQNFENNFSNYIGSKYCVGVNNGTSALHAALLALGIKNGDEILVPSFSFFATCESVSLTGATPIFIDSNYQNFNLDLDHLESKINNNTKAIICVHLYGQSCDMKRLKEISDKYNLYLIEDAAQAHGAEYMNQKVGTFGDFSCFSFYPTKNLGAYGEAGAVLTNNEDNYKKLKSICNHGSLKQYHHDMIGHNFRMSGFQGAILSIKLNYLDQYNNLRIRNAKLYNTYLNKLTDIELPKSANGYKHVFHQYVIKSQNRNLLKETLLKNNIDSAIYYPIPCHLQSIYKNKRIVNSVSEKLSNEVLALPIAEHITEDNIKYISDTICNFYS